MNTILLILIAVAIFQTVRNYRVVKRHKSFKEYCTLIGPLYDGSPKDFIKLADSYIENEKLDEFVNKARVLKTFANVKDHNPAYLDSLNETELEEILLNKNGLADKTKLLLNSDSFFWLLLTVIEANTSNQKDVIENLKDYLLKYEDALNNQLYYQMVVNYIEVCLGNNEGLNIFKKVIEGDYAEYKYAKDLISIFKRMAVSLLVYHGQEVDEDDKKQINSFAEGQAGKYILSKLNMLDEYGSGVNN